MAFSFDHSFLFQSLKIPLSSSEFSTVICCEICARQLVLYPCIISRMYYKKIQATPQIPTPLDSQAAADSRKTNKQWYDQQPESFFQMTAGSASHLLCSVGRLARICWGIWVEPSWTMFQRKVEGTFAATVSQCINHLLFVEGFSEHMCCAECEE